MIGKIVLNPHFNGFGAISLSFSSRTLKTVHFGTGEVPKAPMDERFVKILAFFHFTPAGGCSFLVIPCFHIATGERYLSTSRVIPLIDCHQSLYFQHRTLSTFFQDLCFIWQSHRFQFLGCALPIGLSPSLIPAT